MDIFTTGVLRRIVENLRQPSSFLLDTFFPLLQTETTEEIHFDIDESKPRITPFVAPIRAGKVVANEGFITKTFKPAYAKDKRVFNPSQPLKRAMGEQIGGNLTPDERRQIALRTSVENQLAMLTRREEVMASEALRLGRVTVAGEGYPETIVNFGRDAANTVVLAGDARWNLETSAETKIDVIEAGVATIQEKSGAVVDKVVMEPNAWRDFRKDPEVRDLLNTRRGSASSAESGPGKGEKARFVGTIGNLEFHTYQDVYVDDAGVSQLMLPVGTVILGGSQIEGTRCYGAIQDEAAGYMAERYHVKSWLEQDPAVRWLLLQSAPLVVPYRVNASLSISTR